MIFKIFFKNTIICEYDLSIKSIILDGCVLNIAHAAIGYIINIAHAVYVFSDSF